MQSGRWGKSFEDAVVRLDYSLKIKQLDY